MYIKKVKRKKNYFSNLLLNESEWAKNPSYSAIGTEVFASSPKPSFVIL